MATRQIPGKVRELNLFVSGIGYLGTVESYKLPSVKTKKEQVNGIHVDSGLLEPMEFECDLNVVNGAILGEANKLHKVTLNLKGEYTENGTVKKLAATIGGSIDVDPDTMKAGDTIKTKVKMYVNTYHLELDGAEVYSIDLPNYIAKIGGKDIYESIRSAVM